MEEEKETVIKAKNGDGDAFGLLYDRYVTRIYRFIFIRVSSREDAEDITHQVFLSAWEKITSYEERGFPFSSWLYKIASNAVIDHYRTSKKTIDIEAIPESEFSEKARTEEKIDLEIETNALKDLIRRLEPDQQSVLIMKFVDEMSGKEIAKALDKNEGAVRVIQHRALKKIRKLVHERQHNPKI